MKDFIEENKEEKKKNEEINSDIYYMNVAIDMAKKAFKKNEVPVGAVIVKDNKIISKAYNKREKKQNALYHAEVLAINKACKKLKSFRLENCTMYVTLEPCAMCSGAIINARLKKVVFGCFDHSYGCAGSKYNLLQDKAFEHVVEVEGGINSEECSKIIKNFFANLRKENKKRKIKSRE